MTIRGPSSPRVVYLHVFILRVTVLDALLEVGDARCREDSTGKFALSMRFSSSVSYEAAG